LDNGFDLTQRFVAEQDILIAAVNLKAQDGYQRQAGQLNFEPPRHEDTKIHQELCAPL
jgi:hypothetical protein